MKTFKSYISGKPTRNEPARIVAELMLRVTDPEKFILDFVEDHNPYVYGKVITQLYLESDGAEPGLPADHATGAHNPAGTGDKRKDTLSKATGQFNQLTGSLKQASDETGLSSLLSSIGSWFSGGGAKKNFDKAMTALGKVEGVFNTIKVPENLKTDERFKDYDAFVKELNTAMESLKKFPNAPALAGLMDQLKKDPSVFTLDQAGAEELKKDAEISPPTPADGGDASGGGGDASGGGMDMAKLGQNHPVSQNAVNAISKAAFGPSGNGSDGDFSGFGANADAAKAEFSSVKDKGQEALAAWMRRHQHKDVNMERRVHRGSPIRESVFSEALILAGVPARRRK